MTRRLENFRKLCTYYDWTPDQAEAGSEIARFAACSREFNGASDVAVGGAVSTWDTEGEALAFLGDVFLDGYVPDAVYDLDTGDRIEVHVAAPVVTRSEDQEILANPLADD